MIGIFDSGVGGLASAKVLRERLQGEDIVYLADRKNAPYGTKTKEELISLVTRDIKRLRDYGCRLCLIACCTASSIYPHLEYCERAVSRPIITPAAKAAAFGGRITVIATRHTVVSRAFSREISKFTDSPVSEICAQELVSLVESGECDQALSAGGKDTVLRISEKIMATNPDTLVLGCTHFSHLEESFTACLPEVRIVSAAREGAVALFSELLPERREAGACLYTE